MRYQPAWAQNAVVTSDDQNSGIVKYRLKCPKCGHVETQEHQGSCTIGKFPCIGTCEKCREKIDAYIQRG
ncbi:MAG: hypothetical protein K6G50_08700 [bacterium]|nr:hypothetical protein [bacterium]